MKPYTETVFTVDKKWKQFFTGYYTCPGCKRKFAYKSSLAHHYAGKHLKDRVLKRVVRLKILGQPKSLSLTIDPLTKQIVSIRCLQEKFRWGRQLQ